MAQVSLPTVQPVDKPLMDVRQVARAGETAVRANELSEQMAMSGLQIEGRIIEAKRQLDVKQGQIALEKLQVQLHDDLRKSVTDEQVDESLEHYRQQVPNVLAPFGKDPHAARALQMHADMEDGRMQDVGNVKKADIITKSDNAANNILGETYRQEAIAERLSGGDGSIAEGKYELTLRSSEAHGTLLPAVADAKLLAWKQDVQVGAIEARINDPNPAARQDLINQLKSSKGPLVNGLPEAMRTQMLTAAEEKNRQLTNLAESQDVNAKFNNLLGYFQAHPTTFPTTEAKEAATENPEVLKSIGAVTSDGKPDFVAGRKLRELYTPIGADEKTQAKTKVDKEFDDISKLISDNKLGEAQVMLDKYRLDFEALDANYYRAAESAIRAQVNFNEQQVRFQRGEARAERQETRFETEQKGKQSFSNLMKQVASGQPLDFQKDIAPLLISGDITPTQVRQAMSMSEMAQKDTGVQQGVKLIESSPQFSGTDADNLKKSDLYFGYIGMVRQQGYKGKDAAELAGSMVDEAAKKSVQDAINDAFSWKPGQAPKADEGWWSTFLRFGHPAPTATPSQQPKVLERRRTQSGKVLEKLSDGTIREAH